MLERLAPSSLSSLDCSPVNSFNLDVAFIRVSSNFLFSSILLCCSKYFDWVDFSFSSFNSNDSIPASIFSFNNLARSYSSKAFLSCTKDCSLFCKSRTTSTHSLSWFCNPSISASFAAVRLAFAKSIPQCWHIIPPLTESDNFFKSLI